jgi:hypothetical protein
MNTTELHVAGVVLKFQKVLFLKPFTPQFNRISCNITVIYAIWGDRNFPCGFRVEADISPLHGTTYRKGLKMRADPDIIFANPENSWGDLLPNRQYLVGPGSFFLRQ